MKNFEYKEITSLINKFEDKTLPKSAWTHEAHLIVAIWFCSHHPIEEALNLVRNHIIKYNEAVGTPNTDNSGYHETMTRFWIWVANQFLASQEFDNILDACNAFINSKYAAKDYPMVYYSKTRLFSVEARHQYVDPDLCKLQSLI